MPSRRKFLQTAAIGLPLIACKNMAKSNTVIKPIVIATWDGGFNVNKAAWEVLNKADGLALDAVEAGAISIENDISCCVGLGANPDRDGKVTLDACIMDHQFNCGSVAFLERIKNPISVARKVMESSPHVFLVGEGAQQFALAQGFELQDGKLSAKAQSEYESWLIKSEYSPVINVEKGAIPAPQKLSNGAINHDTMALVALDSSGNLAGACTTSGMAFKMHGRIGDSPIIGSGLYVDNEVGAVTATGQGEEVIRISGASYIISLMRSGIAPKEACRKAVEKIVNINPEKAKTLQVAFIALDKNGNHGAFAIQPEFTYCVRDLEREEELKCDSYFKSVI